jgi:hypothetical protein
VVIVVREPPRLRGLTQPTGACWGLLLSGVSACAQGQPLPKSAPQQLLFRGPHTAWMRKIGRCYWHVFVEWKVWVPITAN